MTRSVSWYILALSLTFGSSAILAACTAEDDCDCADEAPAEVRAGAAPVAQEEELASTGRFTIDNAFYYTQITGGGEEIPTLAQVLFEYPLEDKVKYQVAYVACTCRGPAVNYYSVAYVELSRADGSVVFMSYDKDSSGHYRPGAYGDSTEAGDGTPVEQLFDKFRQERLIGATPEQIFALEPMHGDVDAYSGATVTPNNAVAMLQGLLGYHSKRYM